MLKILSALALLIVGPPVRVLVYLPPEASETSGEHGSVKTLLPIDSLFVIDNPKRLHARVPQSAINAASDLRQRTAWKGFQAPRTFSSPQ